MNLNTVIKYSGYTAAGFYILIGFIVSFEVISRYIFNAPTIWVNEISRLLQIWATYLALTYTFHNKEFIRITVFYDKANDKTKKVLDFISFIFIIYFSSFVTYYGWLIAYDSFEVGRTSSTILDLPAVITEIAIPISFALLLVRVFLEILRYIRDFVKP